MPWLSINGHTIRRNAVTGSHEPPIRIAQTKRDRKPQYAHEVRIVGDSVLRYSPDKPLLVCGARLAIEAKHVEIIR